MKTQTGNRAHTLLIGLAMAGLLCSALGQATGSKGADVAGLLSQAAAHQAKGQVNLAQNALKQALGQAQTAGDKRTEALVKNNLASLWILASRKYRAPTEEPDIYLLEALKIAEELEDKPLESSIRANLGNLLVGWGNYEDAVWNFTQAVGQADKDGNHELAARCRIGMATAAAFHGSIGMAAELAEAAEVNIAKSNERDRALMHIKLGDVHSRMMDNAADREQRGAYLAKGGEQYHKAVLAARQVGDEPSQAYAIGFLAGLYETEGRYAEALQLSRAALRLAQKHKLSDAVYQWQWLVGRLHNQLGDRDRAIGAYKTAVDNLTSIRSDLAIVYGNENSPTTFRDSVGPIYYELADLLLKKADEVTEDSERTALLVEARDTVEALKGAELSDYFQDDCANMVNAGAKSIGQMSPTAAIVYIIPLESRLELLVETKSGLKKVTVDVPNRQLMDQALLFRHHVERRTTYFFKGHGEALYAWLIEPIKAILEGDGVDTLVFVPDGALRNVPMAALFDGENYLLEQYAVGVAPGLSLIESQEATSPNSRFLFSGLAAERHGFPGLPAVVQEAELIAKSFAPTELMDGTFLKDDLEDTFLRNDYRYVHIASHGQFSGKAASTFVLTYDGFLTLDDLENLIRPSSYRGAPVELLTLSACQTAAGDDKAALGLAGVAIKAGCRAALATLWFVSDQASALMVDEFYRALAKPGTTKAKALQHAQTVLRNDPRFRHPRYWAPYIMIGNWL
ncbi:MAG: CHAT domain-containing protein [Verrucomicrobia bacterium]|nr:CHAT domain-containing protein [Verrucomicrobiota bacterium]